MRKREPDRFFAQLQKDGNIVEALKKINPANSKNTKGLNLLMDIVNKPGLKEMLVGSASAKKVKTFFAQLKVLESLDIYSDLSDAQLVDLFNGIVKGNYKSIDDVFVYLQRVDNVGNITATTAKKLSLDYVNFKSALDVLGNGNQYTEFLESIARTDLKYNYNFAEDVFIKFG